MCVFLIKFNPEMAGFIDEACKQSKVIIFWFYHSFHKLRIMKHARSAFYSRNCIFQVVWYIITNYWLDQFSFHLSQYVMGVTFKKYFRSSRKLWKDKCRFMNWTFFYFFKLFAFQLCIFQVRPPIMEKIVIWKNCETTHSAKLQLCVTP